MDRAAALELVREDGLKLRRLPSGMQGLATQRGHKHRHFIGISLPGFIIRGFIWDILMLIFACAVCWGPKGFRRI